MRSLGSSGVWEIFLPGVGPGARYKYEIRAPPGHLTLKADPIAFATDPPPATDSVVTRSERQWDDQPWMDARDRTTLFERPMSVYERHPGSWKRKGDDGAP